MSFPGPCESRCNNWFGCDVLVNMSEIQKMSHAEFASAVCRAV